MISLDRNGRGRVLVVEDDKDVRAELRHVLEDEGFFVVEAADGKQALDILRSSAPPSISLIVLDLVMPYMSGWELVDFLRGDPKFSVIPILVTSGVPVHGDASGIGATMSWLRKPFGRDAFVKAVAKASPSARELDGRDSDRTPRRTISQSYPSYHET